MHSYTLPQWLLIFYLYCFLGWCFESAYVSLAQKHWVNRGFLRAPLLPIYGSGAVCILVTCLPVKNNPAAVFVLGIIFPTILEYITGWAMEMLFKMRYWDYTHKKFNVNGYICLESSIVWGLMSLLVIHVIHPPIGNFIVGLPRMAVLVLSTVISVIFVGDFILSFRTAINLRHVLEEMEKLRTQIDETRVQLELARAEARDRLEDVKEDAQARLEDVRGDAQSHLEETLDTYRRRLDGTKSRQRRRQEELELQMALLRMELKRRMENQNKYLNRALLRAHPTASSRLFEGALEQLRDMANKKKDRGDTDDGNDET